MPTQDNEAGRLEYRTLLPSVLLNVLARNGDTKALCHLGLRYARGLDAEGRGLEADPAKAMALWQDAETRGSSEASYYLGRAYTDGIIYSPELYPATARFEQNYEKALPHLGAAMDGGDIGALDYLNFIAKKARETGNTDLLTKTEQAWTPSPKRDDAPANKGPHIPRPGF